MLGCHGTPNQRGLTRTSDHFGESMGCIHYKYKYKYMCVCALYYIYTYINIYIYILVYHINSYYRLYIFLYVEDVDTWYAILLWRMDGSISSSGCFWCSLVTFLPCLFGRAANLWCTDMWEDGSEWKLRLTGILANLSIQSWLCRIPVFMAETLFMITDDIWWH